MSLPALLLPPSLLLLLALLLASRRWAWAKAALLSALLLALSAWWLIDQLSGDGFNAATVYHLRSGMDGAGIGDFARPILGFLVLALLSLSPLLLVRRCREHRRGGVAFAGFMAAFAAAVLSSPLTGDALRLYQQSRPVDSDQVASEYTVPDKPLRQRRNIVWIYGESLERTYLDPRAFPGLMPNLARLAGEGLDFRGVASAEGSGWTIAGLVSSLCGVPLTTARGDENSMGRMDDFLPGAHCLSDYLKQQGYALHFSGGADAAFAAKGKFLASHGFDTVKEQRYYRERGVARKHFSNWGLHDDVLLDDVFDDFMQLSAAGRPFMLTALTMDTHHPAGHLPVACRGIRYDSEYGDIGLLRALACSDRLISRLVERIRASPHADDTLIVVASDHLAMPNDLNHVLARLPRENLLLYLGSGLPPQQVASAGTTLDSGATLLQLLDPDLGELGFGRSLLAPPPRPSASAALAGDGTRFPLYLGFARQLWTGTETRTLRIDDDRVVAGVQRIRPPVMLEYDSGWNITSIVLEDAPRQFANRDPDNILAYVDRCTAFIDDPSNGEWCALVVDRSNGVKLYPDWQLQQGIQVDAPLEASADARPRPRRALTLSRQTRPIAPGQYQVRLRTRGLPGQSFWVDAVSDDGKVVRAREWVQVGPGGQIRLPLWLDSPVDQLVIRAWLDYTEVMEVERIALVPAPEDIPS
ncbi:phosphoglycerol transferase I [Pseudoxanthomonas suwonensis]|uniref:Phosphoglycerol transferase I n=1 Tax=Pseudoxanthomonas suwonensis TaxID=314722 RepID=A0A0E3UNW7_9GAMM|nr:phosphoglycerol transferase I [Pseudoxanthomonas suwonensis]AKC87330.1 phosphoglycerol transferase I [Pseudoxanthomonas suwonensis]